MTTVVLVHGWGYDASIWDAVRAALPASIAVDTIDFGYFGPERMKVGAGGTVTLAVGHSLGALWWLTQNDMCWSRLLCINGFPRFTATRDYEPAVAPRLLARMQTQFSADPATVLADFHQRCGAAGPATNQINFPALADGLVQLAQRDGRTTLAARRADSFALSASGDLIVPVNMSKQAFAGLPAGHHEMIETAGHLLPLTHPQVCAAWIERLAASSQ